MFDRSVSRTRNPRGRTAGCTRASFVRRGDLRHGAKDQSFRHRKDLGLPNQVCLFRPCQDSALANGSQRPLRRSKDRILWKVCLRVGRDVVPSPDGVHTRLWHARSDRVQTFVPVQTREPWPDRLGRAARRCESVPADPARTRTTGVPPGPTPFDLQTRIRPWPRSSSVRPARRSARPSAARSAGSWAGRSGPSAAGWWTGSWPMP